MGIADSRRVPSCRLAAAADCSPGASSNSLSWRPVQGASPHAASMLQLYGLLGARGPAGRDQHAP
eukprot:12477425-Alexandrium_andersonii.AAC.1